MRNEAGRVNATGAWANEFALLGKLIRAMIKRYASLVGFQFPRSVERALRTRLKFLPRPFVRDLVFIH
jgi:hypothetical protein